MTCKFIIYHSSFIISVLNFFVMKKLLYFSVLSSFALFLNSCFIYLLFFSCMLCSCAGSRQGSALGSEEVKMKISESPGVIDYAALQQQDVPDMASRSAGKGRGPSARQGRPANVHNAIRWYPKAGKQRVALRGSRGFETAGDIPAAAH